MAARLRSRLLFGTLLLAILLVATYRAFRPSPPPEGAGRAEALPSGGSSTVSTDDTESRALVSPDSSQIAGSTPAVVEPRTIEGRVLDAVFGTPVSAWIDPDQGATVACSVVDGRFRLEADASASEALVATAEGYADRGIRLAGRDEREDLEIRLDPSRSAAVIVTYEDGADPSRIPVTWLAAAEPDAHRVERWISTSAYRRGDEHRAETDFQGVSRIPLACRAVAVVEDPRSGATKSVWLQPGQEHRIVLPARALLLRLVDADSLAPVVGLELEAWAPRECAAMAERLVTDARGLAGVLASSYPLLVRRPESAAWQSELLPHSPGATRYGVGGASGTMIRIDAAPQGVVEIGVRECATRIRLRDASTGMPIDAQVRLEVRERGRKCGGTRKPEPKCTVATPRCRHGSGPVFPSTLGELDLPCFLSNVTGLIHGTDRKRRLVVVAAGYRPLALDPGTAKVDSDGVAALELVAGMPRSLRVQLEDGTPYGGPILAYAPEVDLIAWNGVAADGIHGPLDWFGGELVVGHGAEITKWATTVTEAELASSETVAVTLKGARGAIVVEGIPERATRIGLVARLGNEPSHIDVLASSRTGDTVRFDGLTPGFYLVGPRSWLEVVSMRLPEGFGGADEDGPGGAAKVRVVPGTTTAVRWNRAWAAEHDVEGRVVVRCPGRVDLILAPVFDPGLAPDERPILDVQRRSPRIALEADGRYVIREGEPLPRCIAICAVDEATWNASFGLHVLEAILPGESAELQLGSLELVWRGPPRSERMPVSFEIPPERLSRPIFTLHSKAFLQWSVELPLRIDGIPLHVRELRLEGGRTVQIEPVATEVARVEVGPPTSR